MNHLKDTGAEGNNYDSNLKKQYHHISGFQTEVPCTYYRRHEYSQDLIKQPPAEYEVDLYALLNV